MATTFGQPDPALQQAIRRVAQDTSSVRFWPHAEDEMDNDGFDHEDVLRCLRRGTVYSAEPQGPRHSLRANVVYRGDLSIRVVAGGLDDCNGDWDQLTVIDVVTVMKDTR